MTRRLESVRLDTASELQRADSIAPGQAVNRRRLRGIDKVAPRTREAAPASAADHAETFGFESAGGATGKSLDDILLEFVMPLIPDPAILRRSVPILQHLIADLVPGLEGGEQLKSLATTLIKDEIERHRELLGRLRGGSNI